MSECRFKLRSTKVKEDEAQFEKKKALAAFKKLELAMFERKQQDRQVCEDKFRLLFTTSVHVDDRSMEVQVCQGWSLFT